MTTPTLSTPSKKSQYLKAPKFSPLPMKVTGRGCGEIKPHNEDGIRKGLRDLRNQCPYDRVPGEPVHRILITYLPVKDSSSPDYEPQDVGIIRRVLVMATFITRDYIYMPTEVQIDKVLGQTWYLVEDMRMQAKAEQIKDNAMDLSRTRARAQFGNVMEPLVAHAFDQFVLKRQKVPRTRQPDLRGGSGHGTDLLWLELAGLYGELARELGSPFFAELASELATYGETQPA